MNDVDDLRKRMNQQGIILRQLVSAAIPAGYAVGGIVVQMDDNYVRSGSMSILRLQKGNGAPLQHPEVSRLEVRLSDPVEVEVTGGSERSREVASRIGSDYLTAFMSLIILATELAMKE